MFLVDNLTFGKMVVTLETNPIFMNPKSREFCTVENILNTLLVGPSRNHELFRMKRVVCVYVRVYVCVCVFKCMCLHVNLEARRQTPLLFLGSDYRNF